ncbi:glycosyltransferase family 4 protein [Mucilaginibacter auburnensis]|uniref:Glycosyltransferase involved in cell wall biosynthesis n=1 Tax=Mucilaginibacter auburnensis TaxID=1457233 RepID=A0A2H9VM88_9SPHI|nr:glycosyltransferase family 4 protein [Mucilaginibacter auburnensis]PJJ79449.1 glycosyltransferase involved in cell wall biosynthesis [Mucilaginibacter auburnensis]
MRNKIALFSLQTFSTTGGIQKMTRTLSYCLNRISEGASYDFAFWSVYDRDQDLMDKYLPAAKFKGFKADKVKFTSEAIALGKHCHTVILSHINLASVGVAIKLINPKCRVVLIAHGIEVWRPLSLLKNLLLKKCDTVMCVSEYTRKEVVRLHGIPFNKCVVINNALDPFMPLPHQLNKPGALLDRYGLTPQNNVLFTLARLANTEQYKGYDQVIKVAGRLKQQFPQLKYVLAGPYDIDEQQRIKQIIAQNSLEDVVILTGFIEEAELTNHFLMADLFVLPSKKEGFGIVFIEAMACGLPVICGNADGSIDAVKGGKLGTAINPDNPDELREQISKYLQNSFPVNQRLELQKECFGCFNTDTYSEKLKNLLLNDRSF